MLGTTALAFLEAKLNWSGMPITIGGRPLGFTFYPPVTIAAVLAFWLGPTFGAIFKKGKWLYGVLNQNLFSFGGDIKITQLQPILSYTVNEKLSFAIGDDQYTINWNRNKFVSTPLSGQINYIHLFGKQPVRFFFNAQYSFVNEFAQRKWTLTPGMTLILK